ncbi:MAG: bifunctional 3,4-dihydroxy-2-butanone-4-phosphate synthase/GTP cyclohydrolase II [Bacteroidales bacterium]|nr:bifunctional 3,4-dihydroxy-2-butanone-4-phosphate synthase/GTP cyclohydrolase II [Bacteroidales bacterium]
MKARINTIEEAIEDIRQGKIIIVVDDEDRENEGDFVTASELITTEKVNFMVTHGRGLVCTSISGERLNELQIPMMVLDNTSTHETQFTVSVDLLGNGCTTGISAFDRAMTIKALVDKDTKPSDLGRPGHIFPLRSVSGGVLRRAGHTEASLDIAKMAGFYPSGVIVEVMNEDGSMARLPDLMQIAEKFDMKVITIKDLIKYRLKTESLVVQEETVDMPTEFGHFKLSAFRQIDNEVVHLALTKGEWEEGEDILVRVHSSCATGDIFGSCKCDCGDQLHESMRMVEAEGKGIVLYMMQEGRGIGLVNKLKAYHLQELGRDTIEANIELGFKADERDYGVGAQILRMLNACKIRLITNNPTKRVGLSGHGIEIVDTVPMIIEPNKFNKKYLKTKQDKMGHNLHIQE